MLLCRIGGPSSGIMLGRKADVLRMRTDVVSPESSSGGSIGAMKALLDILRLAAGGSGLGERTLDARTRVCVSGASPPHRTGGARRPEAVEGGDCG
jgi:hypothetical protein